MLKGVTHRFIELQSDVKNFNWKEVWKVKPISRDSVKLCHPQWPKDTPSKSDFPNKNNAKQKHVILRIKLD